MSYELCYTSVPQGLKPGTSGFCTVGLTRGTPEMLVERMESLSGYRPLFPASSPQSSKNPVSWAHWRVSSGGQSFSVLSRVCFAGLDYTQRSNKFAHHVALATAECPAGGPAWVLSQGVMRKAWVGLAKEYDSGPLVPAGDAAAAPCTTWAAVCGDAGWAGVLVEAFVASPTLPAYIIYPQNLDILPLIAEALALMPPQRRWQVTFNTYYTDLPAGSNCAWRCCVAGSPAADDARRSGALVIDLSGKLPPASNSSFVRLARHGPADSVADEDPPEPAAMPLLDAGADDDLDVLPLSRGNPSSVRGLPAQPFKRTAPSLADRRPAERTSYDDAPEPLDADSLPPPRRTAVEPRDTRAGSRGPGIAKLLVIGTLWTFAVGAGVFVLMRTQHAAEADRANAEIADLTSKVTARAQRVDELTNLCKVSGEKQETMRAELDARRESMRLADTTQRVEKAQFDRQVADEVKKQVNEQLAAKRGQFDKELAQLTMERDSARADAAAARAALASATPDPRPRENRDPPGLAPEIIQVATIPPWSEQPSEIPLGEPIKGTKIRLISPADVGGAAGDCDFDPEKHTISATQAGSGATKVLCSLEIRGGKMWLKWLRAKNDEDDRKVRAFLQSCLLIFGDEPGQKRQFAAPTSIQFDLAKSAGVKLPPGAAGLKLSREPAWKLDTGGLTASRNMPNAPPIGLSVENGQLSCTYAAMVAGKTTEWENAKTEWRASIAALPKKNGVVDLDALKDKDMPKLRELAELKSQNVKEADMALTELKGLKIPSDTIAVEAKNGVILCEIKIVKS